MNNTLTSKTIAAETIAQHGERGAEVLQNTLEIIDTVVRDEGFSSVTMVKGAALVSTGAMTIEEVRALFQSTIKMCQVVGSPMSDALTEAYSLLMGAEIWQAIHDGRDVSTIRPPEPEIIWLPF